MSERRLRDQAIGRKNWLFYARGGVPRYWIVNLFDGVIETYSRPVAEGRYQDSRVYHTGDEVPVEIDGQEVGRIAAGEILS